MSILTVNTFSGDVSLLDALDGGVFANAFSTDVRQYVTIRRRVPPGLAFFCIKLFFCFIILPFYLYMID